MSPKPFLRWAGGKRWLLEKLEQKIPNDFNDYYEPFLGAGSLFFWLMPVNAHLSDLNNDLVQVYNQIKKNPSLVVKYLSELSNTKNSYYKVRANIPRSQYARAARFIFLNKTCWNGLYRVNRNGLFNVPYGHRKKVEIYDQTNLLAVSKALKNAEIKHCDFEVLLDTAKYKDLVYLDPPYTVAHKNNGFIEYNAKIFSWEDQKRLARVVKTLSNRGCYIVESNASHKSVAELYKKFNLTTVNRVSVIGRNVSSRKKIEEFLITNF
jgi:DNA adenine methylase